MTRSDLFSFTPGAVVVATGAAAAVGATSYPLGSLVRPGPGFFPLILAIALMVMGVGVLVETYVKTRATTTETPATDTRFAWGALGCTFVSLLVFALSVERIGFVPATMILIAICGLVERGRDWQKLVLVAICISVLGSVVFIWGLGLPISAFGGS
ncbi:Tripartite tricarboxylate transporter TctB family protein [Thalassovita gelatinovora]|uniref:Tripartite tricarboxylate transporter TctB family protein n=1 Tax=Thalassovita gelatinovora TaxID=53501 RepID=A0A0P1F6Q5_THAGE|nr:tripartite tricarboxylate transporter TctB family protein [Thalassovita gelatinovora]QIZ79159.1 tripartite tricarboxylate transporter TctB family protein [Thalassovita gelatinovora]CUH63612.1 Tripartite tricarboxylate transporter TctB family protein [Thalassovita gelatinovora]SER00517.1 Tripartite tricarboxylate transporter TctB family protein [Thalassovita gelatinovora]